MNKLELIKNMIENYKETQDMLVSTSKFLDEILELCVEEKKSRKKKDAKLPQITQDNTTEAGLPNRTDTISIPVDSDYITVSVDASIKNNPGGPASIGAVIRFPGKAAIKLSKFTPAQTNNEAEYDAIYEALNHIVHLKASLNKEIVVYSDSQLVVNQLTGKYKINDESKALKRRAQIIHELAAQLPVAVKVEWRPRNSTDDLRDANYAAQDLLQVPRH